MSADGRGATTEGLRHGLSAMTANTRRIIAGAAGTVAGFICIQITSEATTQTGYPVPEQAEAFRRIYHLRILPWSWLPKVFFTWGTTGIISTTPRVVTLGTLWECAVGSGTSWLLRRGPRRAIGGQSG